MKAIVPNFSARYLRQVQEEWLYVQSIRESRNGVRIVNDPKSVAMVCSPKTPTRSGNCGPIR